MWDDLTERPARVLEVGSETPRWTELSFLQARIDLANRQFYPARLQSPPVDDNYPPRNGRGVSRSRNAISRNFNSTPQYDNPISQNNNLIPDSGN
jgi:hypothetical protein